MKHQTVTLVKFKALSRRLGVPMYRTVGILESLWLFAQHNAKDGNLSEFSALEIAGWLEWEGGENELIDALIETRWLDREGDSLQIHGWHEHKPNYLKGADASPAIKKRPPSDSPSGPPSEGHLTEPNLTEPRNLTEPNHKFDSNRIEASRGDQREISVSEFAEVRTEAQRVGKIIGPPKSQNDRELVYKVVWLSLNRFGENWLWDAVNGIAVKKPPPKNKFGYLTKCLKTACDKTGTSLGKELACLSLPDELHSQPPPTVDYSERLCVAEGES